MRGMGKWRSEKGNQKEVWDKPYLEKHDDT